MLQKSNDEAAALVPAAPNSAVSGALVPKTAPDQPKGEAPKNEAGAGAKLTYMDIIQPIPKVLLDNAVEYVQAGRYSEVANMARNGKLGVAYLFGATLNKLGEANKLSQEGHDASKKMMFDFMAIVSQHNSATLTKFTETRNLRENSKVKLMETYQALIQPLNESLSSLVKNAETLQNLLIEDIITQEKYTLITTSNDKLRQTIEKQTESIDKFYEKMIASLGASALEDKILDNMHSTNKMMIECLTSGIVKITESSVSATKIFMDAMTPALNAGAARLAKAIEGPSQQLSGDSKSSNTSEAENKDDKPKKKGPGGPPPARANTKTYSEHRAIQDAGEIQDGCLDYKTGDVLYLCNRESKHFPGWFKAGKSVAAGRLSGEKGLVNPSDFKPLKK